MGYQPLESQMTPNQFPLLLRSRRPLARAFFKTSLPLSEVRDSILLSPRPQRFSWHAIWGARNWESSVLCMLIWDCMDGFQRSGLIPFSLAKSRKIAIGREAFYSPEFA